MPDTLDLLSNLRSYLVAQGLVRVPTVAGSDPPLWLEPRLGTPAPGEKPQNGSATEIGPTLVIGAVTAPGIAPQPYGSFKRIDGIDIWMRASTAKLARDFEVDLRSALTDKRDWDMDDLRIIESRLFRDLQRVGSDEQGFDFITGYLFERYRP